MVGHGPLACRGRGQASCSPAGEALRPRSPDAHASYSTAFQQVLSQKKVTPFAAGR